MYEVISSNPNQKGGFVTKIQGNQTTVFGAKKVTYYVSGTLQLTVGQQVKLDINEWKIATYPFANPETGEIMELKWLHLK